MGKTSDSDFDMENFGSDADPFVETGEESPPVAPPLPRKKAGASNIGSQESRPMAGLTADVPVQVVAVLGKKVTTIKEIISLKKGQVLELNRFPNEAIDLVANGRLIAKGELVEIDGKLGVRIIKIFE